jgi:2-dehydropantoate 2-reductase
MPEAEYFIVGAGGIGCAVGHALCAAGLPIVFVDTDPEKLRWGRKHGVGVDDRPALPATFLNFDDWSPPEGAVVLLCTKCYNNAAVLARVPPSTTLLPIQNGFDRALEGRGTFPEGIASFVSECHPQRTQTRITRQGRLHLGMHHVSDRAEWRADQLAVLAERLRKQAAFQVEEVADILPFKHSKLMYNAAISPLAAAAGLDNGQLLSIPRARHLFFELLRENYAILHMAGVSLGRIGPLHPKNVNRILRHGLIARALGWAFYPTLRGSYCSMSGDIETGQTEIDFYNGYLIELAGARPCPLNRRVYALIQRMQQERATPGLGWLECLKSESHVRPIQIVASEGHP